MSVHDRHTLAIWVAVVITIKIICIFRSRVAIIRVSEIKSAEVRPRVVNELGVREVKELDFLTRDALVHPIGAVPLPRSLPKACAPGCSRPVYEAVGSERRGQ